MLGTMESCLTTSISLLLCWVVLLEGVLITPDAQAASQSMAMEMEIQDDDDGNIQHVASIIDSLENLNVLDGRKQSCYTLDKIVKTQEAEEGAWKVAVYFYVREITDHPDNTQDTGLIAPGVSDTAAANGTANCIGTNSSRLADSSGTDTGSGGNVSDSSGGYWNGSVYIPSNEQEDPNVGQGDPNLSDTQMTVILTCSVVIGVFFIMALALRVRNYVKRLRNEGRLPRRITYRGMNIGMSSGSTQSDINKENTSPTKVDQTPHVGHVTICINNKKVKVAAPPKVTVNNHSTAVTPPRGYYHNQNHYDSHEVKPLLVITSASAPSSPMLAHKEYTGREGVCRSQTEDYSTLRDMDFPHSEQSDVPGDECVVMAIAAEAGDAHIPGRDGEMPVLQETLAEEGCGTTAVTEDMLQRQLSECDPTVELTPVLEITNEEENSWSLYSLANTGITQSDSSLNSSNPSYRYGNQVEYSAPYEDYSSAGVPDVIITSSSCQELLPKDEVKVEEQLLQETSESGSETEVAEDVPCKCYGDYVNQNFEGDSPQFECSCGSGTPVNRHDRFDNQAWRHTESIVGDDAFCDPHDLSSANQIINGYPHRSSSLKRRLSEGQRPQRKSVTFSLDIEDEEMQDCENENMCVGDENIDAIQEKPCSECTFLLGEEFEGMEPTYV